MIQCVNPNSRSAGHIAQINKYYKALRPDLLLFGIIRVFGTKISKEYENRSFSAPTDAAIDSP